MRRNKQTFSQEEWKRESNFLRSCSCRIVWFDAKRAEDLLGVESGRMEE